MQTLKNLFVAMLGLGLGLVLLGSCSYLDPVEVKGHEVPFKAKFYTLRDYSNSGEGFCTEDPYLSFNYQVGEGIGTHLGKFTTTISFCGRDQTPNYKNGQGVFVAANGDELYFLVPSPGEIGRVNPFEHPLYEGQFQDAFTFSGGTGRFEGASGVGVTNSLVDLLDDEGNFIPEHQTDHEWIGTLIIPSKGK